MRILHVIPALTHERGGPTTVVCALTRHQAAAGHQVHVLATDQGARSGERPVELPAGVTSDRAAVRGPDRLAFAPGFSDLARRRLQQCDVVHVHSIFTYPVHIALREALAARVPAIVRPCGHLHQYSLRRSRWLKRIYLAMGGGTVRRACACWHYTSAQEALGSWPGPNHPQFILPNGIEPEEFAVDRAEALDHVARVWPALAADPYVLFLARLHPKKRLDLLLEAFRAGAPRPFKLVIAGPDECDLWQLLAERYLSDAAFAARVVRIGTVAGRDKVALLAAAALFALPSEHENFGNAALEALATGTPVLLSPHVDFAGPIGHAAACHRAPLDAASWAESFATLLTNDRVTEGARDAVREEIRQTYSWRRLTAELVDRYRWVLGGCPANVAALSRDPHGSPPRVAV